MGSPRLAALPRTVRSIEPFFGSFRWIRIPRDSEKIADYCELQRHKFVEEVQGIRVCMCGRYSEADAE